MTTNIYVKTRFVALHRWKDAPEDIAFLRDYHRHEFHVKVTLLVTHAERQVEFYQFKRELDGYIQRNFAPMRTEFIRFDYSCETLAQMILCWCVVNNFPALSVDVNEDGDNGAIVYTS